MNLVTIAGILIAAWGLLHFVFLRRLEAIQIRSARLAALKAVVEYLRLFALIGSLTYMTLLAVVTLSSTNVHWINELSGGAEAWHERVEAWGSTWTIVILTILSIALVSAAARRSSKRATAENTAYFEEQWQRIDERRRNGSLEQIELTPELQAVVLKISEVEALGEDVIDSASREALLQSLYTRYYVLDTQRRIPPPPAEPTAKRSPREQLLNQFGAVFASRGTLALASGGAKAFTIAGNALLCASLVGIVGVTATQVLPPAANAATITATQVAVHHEREEAEALLPPPELAVPRTPTSSEQQAIRVVAQSFARNFYHAQGPQIFLSPRDVAEVRQAHTRAAVLSHLEPGAERQLAGIPSLSGPSQDIATRVDAAGYSPADPVANEAATSLEAEISREPEAESKTKLHRLLRGFAQPATFDDIRDSVLAQSFSAILEVNGGHADPAAVRVAHSALADAGGVALKEYVDVAWDRFSVAAIHDNVAIAMSRVADPTSESARRGRLLLANASDDDATTAAWDRVVNETSAHPPAAPARDMPLPSWAVAVPPGGETGFATTFADIAPAGYGDDLRTAQHRMDSEQMVGESSEKIPNVSDPVPEEVAEAAANGLSQASDEAIDLAGGFVRSRSYGLLSGFSRIGGVLIGAPASTSRTVDCRSLSWNIRGNRVVLKAAGPNCPWRAASLNRAILARALAYAADGRPVATTMVSSAPLLDGLSVHVHPALVDTPIGADATTIDTFVDTYYRYGSYHDPLYARAAARIDNVIDLYQVAAGEVERTVLKSDSLNFASSTVPSQYIDEYRNDARAIETAFPDARVTSLLKDYAAAEKNDAKRASLLSDKPAYFESTVARLVDSCSRVTPTGKAYRGCILRGLDTTTLSDPEHIFHWLAVHSVRYQLESGVREIPYERTEALRLDDSLSDSSTGVGPFRFEIHVTFDSKPAFAKNGAEALRQDSTPYGLPEIEPHIAGRIRSLAASDTSVAAVLHHMAEFTRAQRFFRLAFNGELGSDFPSDRLIQLAAALHDRAEPHTHTIRWLARPDEYLMKAREALETLELSNGTGNSSMQDRLARRMSSALEKCVVTAYANGRRTHRLVFAAPTCAYGVYSDKLDTLQQCESQECIAIKDAYTLLKVMRLRDDLHVADDDHFLSEDNTVK